MASAREKTELLLVGRSGEDEAAEEEASRQLPVRRKKAGQEQLKAREGGIPSTQISEREIVG